jgi:polyphenol oxidase
MGDPETLVWTIGDVTAVCSCAADGDARDPAHRDAFLRRAGIPLTCIVPRQVHGVQIDVARPGAAHAGADGLVTTDTALALGVFGADCPGLVLAAPDALAVAHCGWRGVAGGIVGAAVAALALRSRHPPATWRALIGPGISGQRYEIDGPVLAARPWPAASLMPGRPGRAQLDLAAAIAADLAQGGVTTVQRSGVCTAGDRRLHSRRRDGPGLAQVLVAWRRAP